MGDDRVYFVVLDPASKHQPALERAISLARVTGASLHAFVCTWLDDEQRSAFTSHKQAKQAAIEEARDWGQGQIQKAIDAGLNADIDVYWNADWHKAIPRAAKQRGADLIIKSTFYHNRSKRLLHSTSDYTLLRYASCPVLLTQESNNNRYATVLAAVDLSANKAHADLNEIILKSARRTSKDCDSDLHLVTALDQLAVAPVDAGWIPDSFHTPGRDEISREFNVPAPNIHVYDNNPSTAIIDCVKQVNADLLVIGTTARKGLSGALVGNTAEKVLDSVTCDLLVVNLEPDSNTG